jgi:hypothetical protein
MMRLVVVVFMLLLAQATSAVCLSPPRVGLTVDQVAVQFAPGVAAGEVNALFAWPTTTANEACCTRTNDASRQWQTALGQHIANGPMRLSYFATTFVPPGSSAALTDAERVTCQALTDMVLAVTTPIPPAIPAVYIVVAAIAGQTDRPLYNAAFATIGRVEFLLNGSPRICEPTPILKVGSPVKYYYATNNAGIRGLAVCKPG